MRESSFLFSKQNSQQPKYQGGEKKVMKKSLSLILAIAMVFSMFASVAFAAEATTTDTPKTTEEKYDALKALGIFEGDETGANLEGDMTRAQLAKIVAKLLKVEENKAANTYTDVPADHWAAGFIGAATEAKAFDGVAEGKFDPEGKVSYQQLATVLVRLTGLAQSTDEVTGKVDDWAKGYVAVAVKELGLTQADYTVNATRGVFVELTFAALPKVVIPGKVSVTEAKATGVKTVEVKFNKAVDTAAAKLALTKGSIAVATTAKFSDDKTSAVLTLTDVKVSEGTYTVTLSGLAADTIGTATGTFTAENEKLTKLDFVTTSDTLAEATTVIVKLKAANQYGENASFSAGAYTVVAKVAGYDINKKLTRNDAGDLLLYLDTKSNTSTIQTGIGVIPVIVYHNDTRITASKNFTKGTAAFISKTELGAVKYSNGGDSIKQSGETATFDVLNYDQYGNIMPYLASRDTTSDQGGTAQVYVSPYESNIVAVASDSNNDEVADVKVNLSGNVDRSGEYTVTVYNEAGTASTKIKVNSAKLATKIEIGDLTSDIAAGDDEAFISLVGYDADGNQLSVEDLTSDENTKSRITLSASNVDSVEIVKSGENKGKIRLAGISNTPQTIISLTGYIVSPNTTGGMVNKTYTVKDARYPDSIKLATEPAKKIVAEAESAFKYVVYDQYGKELKTFANINAASKVNVGDATGTGITKYQVTVTTTTYGGVKVWSSTDTPVSTKGAFPATVSYSGSDVGSYFTSKEHKFYTGTSVAAGGYATVSAVIEKITDVGTASAATTEISSKITRKIEAFDSTKDLTYSVNAVSDLYAAVSNVTDSTYVSSKAIHSFTYDNGLTLSYTDQINPTVSALAREVTVAAKDSAGNTVAVPKKIKSLTASDPAVAITGLATGTSTYTGTGDTNSQEKAYVIGNAAGSATLNVSFVTADGNISYKTATVNVKNDALTSTAIVNDTRTTASKTTYGQVGQNVFVVFGFKVTDNYGKTYAGSTLQKYNYLFGVVFSVKVTETTTGGTDTKVVVDQYGNLTYVGADVVAFEVTATTASGKSVTGFIKD
ncbi:S-layer homology domain-containing protein [Paenibacillus sp. YN15]|uniref:S-layer homology domain-containing protein n=1 Tax=Paenibacillus sp. YN15 TaxID=1742774 RepID=UPI000DCB1BD4|nr:S-layer homology domain-containing protein [Paenibacillus sp. YN15]RAV03120.1 hypothetical protein DQG13_08715 [Paenibacillus sp. YN15]